MQDWLQNSIETFQFGNDEKPYVDIHSLSTKMGLDWQEVREELMANDHWGFREEDGSIAGGAMMYSGLPTEKLFLWLKTVNPVEVIPSLRQALMEYQATSRQMTADMFLRSDLLAYVRQKKDRTPLEQRLLDAAEMLERQKGDS